VTGVLAWVFGVGYLPATMSLAGLLLISGAETFAIGIVVVVVWVLCAGATLVCATFALDGTFRSGALWAFAAVTFALTGLIFVSWSLLGLSQAITP
jgi:hypothetical protein